MPSANATPEKTEPPTDATSSADDTASGTRFRVLLIAAISFLVVAVVGAATAATAVVLDRAARTDVRASLTGAERVFSESWAQRRSVLRSEARVIAEEPRLKAVTSAEDVGRDTVVGVALELHQAVQSDLFVLTDAEGRLLLDAAAPDEHGHDMKSHEVIRDALSRGDASGVWTAGSVAYQVQARRLEFGETPFGVLVIGYAVGQKLVDSLERQIGARAIVELDGIPVTVSDASSAGAFDKGSLKAALAALPSGGVHEVHVGNARYLAVAGKLPGYTGQRTLRYALLRSLDAALAPSLRLRNLMLWIAVGALLVTIVAASALSKSLSRPLEALAVLTHEFSLGKLSARVAPTGPLETRALGVSLNRMAGDLERTQKSLRQKDRLERELEIAERIQTALLPDVSTISRLEVASRMLPAATVGGDYFDIRSAPGGAWIGVGDVAGHGLTAGLIMLMVQSGTATLVRALPTGKPSELVTMLNEIVYSNVNERLKESEHVTFSLLRYHEDGRVVFAGAHEDLVVYRKRDKRCETVRTPGMWLGALPTIGEATRDSELLLEPGDLLVLYSDGITEALDEDHVMYGIERLIAKVESLGERPVSEIRDAILAEVRAHSPEREDDQTLIVARHLGPA